MVIYSSSLKTAVLRKMIQDDREQQIIGKRKAVENTAEKLSKNFVEKT